MTTYQLARKDRQRRRKAMFKTGFVAAIIVLTLFGWDAVDAVLALFREAPVEEVAVGA